MGYSNSEIGHNWAHQLKKRQNGSNFSFEGSRIYSYSTVIGQVVQVNKQAIYLLNTGSCSNSTSKHQGFAFGAIPNDAIKFSVSCDQFEFHWSGYWDFDKNAQIKLVKKYIHEMYKIINEFSESKSTKDESEFSLRWYNDAKRLCEITKCTTLKQLYKEWKKDNIETFYVAKGGANVRRMLKALNEGVTDLKELVDITCGEGTWKAYLERTKGARTAFETRRINLMLGFKSDVRRAGMNYYVPFKYIFNNNKRRKLRNLTFLEYSCAPRVEGHWDGKTIEKYRKQGILVKEMCNVRRHNLLKNLELEEQNRQYERVKKAKMRLEKHMGMRGWQGSSWGVVGFTSFDYNGTVYVFGNYNRTRELSMEEYVRFTRMSKDEQASFIYDKKAWMLSMLQQEHEEHLAFRRRQDEWQREIDEHIRLVESKKEYIESKKAEGDSGLIQLFREGLVDGGGFYGKGVSFFNGGNALLRVNEKKQRVETSKGIHISFDECKRLWAIVSRWHKNGMTFTESDEKVNATRQTWSINRFQNDIMIAGCHAIHFSEMEYAAKQMGLIA